MQATAVAVVLQRYCPAPGQQQVFLPEVHDKVHQIVILYIHFVFRKRMLWDVVRVCLFNNAVYEAFSCFNSGNLPAKRLASASYGASPPH